ncbi:hypothetical protein Bbelb_130650 [Branchiostoma belcheri]|nr:hypothetical protein Bbelb_130650 [Branchiostoma belcheri]
MRRHVSLQAPRRSVGDNYPTIYVQMKRVSLLQILRISYRLTGVESSHFRGIQRRGIPPIGACRTGKGTYTPPPSSAMTQAAAAGSKHRDMRDLRHVTSDVSTLVPRTGEEPRSAKSALLSGPGLLTCDLDDNLRCLQNILVSSLIRGRGRKSSGPPASHRFPDWIPGYLQQRIARLLDDRSHTRAGGRQTPHRLTLMEQQQVFLWGREKPHAQSLKLGPPDLAWYPVLGGRGGFSSGLQELFSDCLS